MAAFKSDSKQKEAQNMNIKLLGENYTRNLAYDLLQPTLEEYGAIADYLDVQSGRISATTYVINNEKNCHTVSVRQSHDTIILQSTTNRFYINKDPWYLKIKVCCPTFSFRRRDIVWRDRENDPDDEADRAAPFPSANVTPARIIETFTWESLPSVVCHRSMFNLRAIHSIKQTWSGSVLLDETASGVQEKCFKIQWGLMGDSYTKQYWQQYIPDCTYAELGDPYSKYNKYQISTGEFYGLESGLGVGDFRMIGLELIIPMLLIQPQDLTYQSQFCMNRVNVSYKISLGSIAGIYAFLTHNIEEAPWTEHPFEDPIAGPYNIPRIEKAGISSMPGHLNKYIGLYLESSGPSFYTPYAGHRAPIAEAAGQYSYRTGNKDILHGPNVLGHNCFSSIQKTPHSTSAEVANQNGTKVYRNPLGDSNLNACNFNTIPQVPNSQGTYGIPDGWQDWILGPLHTFPNEYFLRYYDGAALVPTGNVPYSDISPRLEPNQNYLVDAFQNMYGYVAGLYSDHFRFRRKDSGYAENLKQPFVTPVVSSEATPAALPNTFSGLNAAEAHLRFRLTSASDFDIPDQNPLHPYTAADDDRFPHYLEGALIPNSTISYESNCESVEVHATLLSTAGHILNEKRDSASGMRTNFWHSQDTSDGQFDIDPKSKFISIELNSGNKLGWNHYHIMLTRYKKTESDREHPLSFHDYDCVPFNKIFQSMTIKWQTVEGDQQFNWDVDQDPDMSKKLYPATKAWTRAFQPEEPEMSYQTWLNKPVWIFSPNQNGGTPLRRWEPATTSRIDLVCYLRNDLTAGDFYSLFGSKYIYDQSSKWMPTFKGPVCGGGGNIVRDRFHTAEEFAENPTAILNAAGNGAQNALYTGTSATWDPFLSPGGGGAGNPQAGNRDIKLNNGADPSIVVKDSFEVLYGSVSPVVLQVVSTVGNICWLTGGVTIDGRNDAGCTFLIKSSAGGPATVHLSGVKQHG